MHVDLVVLLVPGVHPRPLERHVSPEGVPLGRGVGMPPRGVFGQPVADPHRPANPRPLAGARSGMARGHETAGAHVLPREVVHGQVTGLSQEQDPLAVGDVLAGEADPDPARTRLELVTRVWRGARSHRHRPSDPEQSTAPERSSRAAPSRARVLPSSGLTAGDTGGTWTLTMLTFSTHRRSAPVAVGRAHFTPSPDGSCDPISG